MCKMESIFHEKQDGSLCAQHCLNALLQGEYFTAVDLATLAHQMDEAERQRMAEGGVNSEEYMKFLEQPSTNMDDSGYFSIQVIASALGVWNLELIPYNSQHVIAKLAKGNPVSQSAFICNYRDHWFTIRKLGNQWFNLNSLLTGPELISNTYLAMFLAQLQQEGYSIFIVQGSLPDCEADEVLRLAPAVQLEKPRLLSEVANQLAAANTPNTSLQSPVEDRVASEDEESQLQQALRLSLQAEFQSDASVSNQDSIESNLSPQDTQLKHTSGLEITENNSHPKINGSDNKILESSDSTESTSTVSLKEDQPKDISEMSEEAMLEVALKMSMDQDYR